MDANPNYVRRPGRMRSLTPEDESEIVRLVREGKTSNKEIAEKFGISRSLIYVIVDRHK